MSYEKIAEVLEKATHPLTPEEIGQVTGEPDTTNLRAAIRYSVRVGKLVQVGTGRAKRYHLPHQTPALITAEGG